MCDIMVALGNVIRNGRVFFAKNSDRNPDEPAEIIYLPHRKYPKGSIVQATYIKIPLFEKLQK